ncbi:MAG: DNA alkylation repair protein [Acidobacteria bacterium]|nr:DNA alkylation repair protein [Acidobacteriota bacterium]
MSESRPGARRPATMKRAPAGPAGKKTKGRLEAEVQAVLASLKRLGSKRNRDGMARYGIVSHKAFGVPVSTLQQLAKRLGRNHELAAALWDTGWYEARMLCAFVDEPERVTAAQMDRWRRDFDNWAICDTVCFHLFDRTPQAFRKVVPWSRRRDEFGKRAAFALLASLALHDKRAADDSFTRCLPLVERAATDERNFVKKGVSWALRGIGRRNLKLHPAAVKVAQRLSASPHPAARWVGRDALRELSNPKVVRQLEARRRESG